MTPLLPLRAHHGYLRTTPHSAYWALSPFQIQQHTDSSCSLATTVMLLNAIRGLEGQLAIGAPVSELSLLDHLQDSDWRTAITPGVGHGLTLQLFAERVNKALASFALSHWRAVPHPVGESAAAEAPLRSALLAMESADGGFVAANFHLDTLYGDGSDIGHLSPLGAYDAARDLVLVLDVYKKDYEPHWVALSALTAAMSVRDKTTQAPRGYAVVQRS